MSTLDEAIAEAFGEDNPAADAFVEQPEAPAETPVDGTSEEQPAAPSPQRDEQGRFVSQQQSPDVQKYLERFGGDLDKALAAAVEADRFIGRQGQEKGELQKELEQIKSMLAPEQQGVPLDQNTVDWFDQMVDTSPQEAVQWAMQNDPSGVLYNRAMDAWYQEEPRAAAALERRIEMAEMARHIDESQRPFREQALRNEFVNAWSEVSREIPDLDAHAQAMIAAAESTPEVVAALKEGTPDAQRRVIRTLYKLAKFDAVLQANQPVSGDQPQNPQSSAPFVASQDQYVEPQTKSAGEQWFEDNIEPELQRYYGGD